MQAICRGDRALNWRAYKMADGLPESACVSVTVSAQGKVLVRHSNLLLISELDGFNVLRKPAPDRDHSPVYQSPGGQLWTVGSRGLEELTSSGWVRYSVPDVLAALQSQTAPGSQPAPLYPIRQALVLVLLPDGLYELNTENPDHPVVRALRLASSSDLGKFSGMVLGRDGSLWLTANRGLVKAPGPLRSLQPSTTWTEYPLPSASQIGALFAPHLDANGTLTSIGACRTNNQHVLVSFDGETWTFPVRTTEKVSHFWHGPDQTSWAITRDALFQVDELRSEMRESEDVPARQYMDVAIEPNGAFWLATSDGLFRYAPLLWSTPLTLRPLASPVSCLTGDAEGRIWFASGNRVRAFQSGQVKEYSLPVSPARLQARALYVLRNGAVLLSSQNVDSPLSESLYEFRSGLGFVPLPHRVPGRKFRALGLLKEAALCVQDVSAPGPGYALELYDGSGFEPLTDPPPAGVLGTNLIAFFATQKGDLWLSGENGTAWYHDRKWRVFDGSDQTSPVNAFAFTELPDGRLWCASEDQLWEFDGRAWSTVRRGFDRINDIQRSRDGSLWVASNNGLHRFFQGAWVENSVEDGLPSSSVRELYEDQRGQLWAATTRGLSLFHPDADPDQPRTSIEEITETGGSVRTGGIVSLTFHGMDKWKYTARDRLLYSYRLDEHDWSPFQEVSQKSFSDLPAGNHVLQVRAMDRAGNVENRAVKEFSVVLPWYKETRLMLISSAGLALALFFAWLAFNRHRQLVKSYAEVERKVAERTQQLEVASHELLQSQKMRALGTLAAGIAHDFNNILSIIKGSAQIIEENLENPQKVRIRAERIRTVVEQGSGLVKAMLGFSRDSGQQLGPCDVNATVQDTLKLLGDRFSREIQVRFHPCADLPQALASRELVQQVLLNFIFNAVESMSENKEVVLETFPLEQLPAELALAPEPAAGYIAVSVRDFGCGIPPANLSRVFEPFFTTKAFSSRRGTGLGLSMVYELAKKLEAGLMVKSVVGQGSTFTLFLAMYKNVEAAKAEHEHPNHSHH